MAPNDQVPFAESTALNSSRSINWTALAIGTFTFLAIQFCFTLLASAIGLAAFQVGIEIPGTSSNVFAGFYGLISIVAAFFAAGYASSRIAEFRSGRNSLVQGFSTWVISTSILAYLLTNGLGSLMGGLGAMTNLLLQGSVFLFFAFSLGLIACVAGAVINHRHRYFLESRLAKVVPIESTASRPRRIA